MIQRARQTRQIGPGDHGLRQHRREQQPGHDGSQNVRQQGNVVRKQVFMSGPSVAYLMKCTNACALGVISCRHAND